MHDQPVIEPFEATEIFADGSGNRPLLDGTVARGLLADEPGFWTGLDGAGRPVREMPVAVTEQLLHRGRSRYEAFCSPCHDRTGRGRGMVVKRGFKQPASFHEDRLRQQPVGYFFTVISNGFGEMSSYASQIKPEDRWAIVAYLKTLQWSGAARLTELPADLRAPIEAALEDRESAPVTTEHESQ
jgi:mono/diheme cytochrome c family protein